MTEQDERRAQLKWVDPDRIDNMTRHIAEMREVFGSDCHDRVMRLPPRLASKVRMLTLADGESEMPTMLRLMEVAADRRIREIRKLGQASSDQIGG